MAKELDATVLNALVNAYYSASSAKGHTEDIKKNSNDGDIQTISARVIDNYLDKIMDRTQCAIFKMISDAAGGN